MTSLTLQMIAGGSLALLAMLLGVVALARKLEGVSNAGRTDAPAPAEDESAGSLAATLATLAAHTGVSGAKAARQDTPEKASTAKQLITGLAIAGGLIALVMGIIAGDG